MAGEQMRIFFLTPLNGWKENLENLISCFLISKILLSCFRLDLNAAESGVQHNPSQPGRTNLQGVSSEQQGGKDSCPC